MIYAETGTTPNVQVGPRPILRIMSLFNADIRPALDVFYQFDRPFVVTTANLKGRSVPIRRLIRRQSPRLCSGREMTWRTVAADVGVG